MIGSFGRDLIGCGRHRGWWCRWRRSWKRCLEGAGKAAASDLQRLWKPLKKLEKAYFGYVEKYLTCEREGKKKTSEIKPWNKAQHKLSQEFSEFFERLLAGVKGLDKTVRDYEAQMAEKAKAEKKGRQQVNRAVKELKGQLEELQQRVKLAESFFGHGWWLQERFPEASYGDVTGLCKLATLAEVGRQDYVCLEVSRVLFRSGCYVGVVIEEDGKTEEEFREEILGLNEELERLNGEAHSLETIIAQNIKNAIGAV